MRAIVFVDYWNLQLTLQREDGRALGLSGQGLASHRFGVDWFNLGPKLTQLAANLASPTPGTPLQLAFQETRIYTSTDPADSGYKHFALNIMGRRPGIRVSCQDRRHKYNPNCPHCFTEMDVCPHCTKGVTATQEKGVDTLLVTDLLCLGLDKSYDVAILVTQDSDMAPAAEHLGSKGIKVIQAGVKHYGAGLAKQCWANFDLFPVRDQIQRPAQPTPKAQPSAAPASTAMSQAFTAAQHK